MKNSIIVPFILLFFQCTKDDNSKVEAINCIGEADLYSYNCDFFKKDYCEINSLGKYFLAQSSKKYLPLFCRDTGSTITYQNNVGKEIIFTLVKKHNMPILSIYHSERCPSDDSKWKGDCIISDWVGYNILADSIDLELKIALLTIPDTKKKVGYVGDVLDISRRIDSITYQGDFYAVVNQRTLSYNKTQRQEFYPTLEISGINYKNVISYDITNVSKPYYKYYYNNEIGLIGFQDTNGVTWTLKQ